MKIQFSREHNAPHIRASVGPYTNYRYLNSQLALCVTGTPETIAQKLKKIAEEIETGSARKPIQGTVVSDRCVAEVLTPVWNGDVYNDSKAKLELNEE